MRTKAELGAELAAARLRLAELEAAEADRRRAEQVQDALYRIAETAGAAQDMQEFYAAMHRIVGELMYANNFYIALYDEERQMINFAFYVDEVDLEVPDPNVWEEMGTGQARGVTAYVLRTGEPLLATPEVYRDLQERGEVAAVGEHGMDWLGVPLRSEGRTLGVLVVQTYTEDVRLTEQDKELLTFVAQHIAAALERTRLLSETRQRAAELEIVNSVGQALGAQLDLEALIELVGERMRETFDADIVYVALHDPVTDVIDFPYYVEGGERRDEGSLTFGEGLTSRIIESRRPQLLNKAAHFEELGTRGIGIPAESYLGVPIMAGEAAIGVISVQSSLHEGRFGEADVRLLSTIAANVGVAIQNAQLYEEVRRRADETAALADIGREISATLDLSEVLEHIAARALDLIGADSSAVYLAEGENKFSATVALGNNADQIKADRIEPGQGIIGDLAARGAAEVVNDVSLDPRALTIPGTEKETRERLMVAPLLGREHVVGVMAVWRYGPRRPFTQADLNFLVGLSQQAAAGIENARLFEAQREAEHRYRRLVEELPMAVYTDKPDQTATSIYISPRVEALFGYPPDAWMDEPFFASVLHPDDRERVTRALAEEISGDTDRTSSEYRIVAADGRIVWVRDDQWIVRDKDGTPLHVQGFMIDVTEQTLAAAEVRRQKQYFESLVEISPVAVVVMDNDERVTGWNPAATRLFGYEPEEAIGRLIEELVLRSDELRDEGVGITREVVEMGRVHRITGRTRKDASLVDVEMVMVPLVVDGERVGFYVIYHDITELQRAREEAEAATQAKSAFLATMSHEIRTPMNAVIGMTGLLLDTELTPEQRGFAEVTRTSGDALLRVIDDILDYSKIEAGKLELEREPFDLRECIENALDIVAVRASDKTIELGFLPGEELPAHIVGDSTRLRQVLLNLLSNGVKFTEEGEVVLELAAERGKADGWRLHFAVRDTGIGIPKDRIERLFESFSQVDASTARRYGGTGLGLAISRRLVELMGGEMWAESEEGKGSTFHVTLAAEEADVPARLGADDVDLQLAGKRLLVVDDNATNREILTRQAGAWGMSIEAVELPSEALARLRRGESYDVAVIDMVMPEMDGITLAREIRRNRAELPLLLTTSLGHVQEARSATEFAAQLTKPVKASQLYDAIVIALAQHTPDQSAPILVAVVANETNEEAPSLRILLAEDNPVNRKLALALLGKLGYRADVVGNGLEALDAVQSRLYDVVLMDVQMPELDGLEATRRIRARFRPGEGPTIIAMTANAMQGDRDDCLAAGMDDYLAKPIRVDELAGALARCRPLAESRAGGS